MMTHAQPGISIHEVLSDAIRYWEPRRAIYNLALVGVVGAFALSFRTRLLGHFSFELIFALLVLAVLANVCYCAAYVADVPMQLSVFRDAWRRRRWMLWLFGVALAWYWVGDEILPGLLGR